MPQRDGDLDEVAVARGALFGGVRRRTVVAAILAFGVALRILQFAANRSLWMDEALLAPRILDHSLAELLHPARWAPIPPGFLLGEKLVTLALGTGELALRLIPLLSGLAALAFFWALARRVLSANGALVALALFSFSPFLIYYSSELKWYSSDVAVALALLLLALHLGDRGWDTRGAATWAAAGIVAVGVSLTAAFVLAGATTVSLAHAWHRGDRRSATRLGAVAGAWALIFGIPFLLLFGIRPSDGYLGAFWQGGFMPLPPRSLADLAWYPQTLLRVFRDPLGILGADGADAGVFPAAAGILCFAVGCAWMGSRDRLRFWLLVSPILATLLASALGKYPFGGTWASGGRVILFLVPSFLLIVGEGAEQLRRALGGALRPVALAVLALLVVPPTLWGLAAVPTPRAEIKPILEYVRENWQPGDRVYVQYDTRHAFDYYAPRFGFTPQDRIDGVCARLEPQRYLNTIGELRGAPRVWFLFGGGIGAHRFDERGFIVGFLNHLGRRLDDQVAVGSSVYLYDLTPTPRSETPFQAQIPVLPERIEEGCALWQ